jgi:hypothetical protein
MMTRGVAFCFFVRFGVGLLTSQRKKPPADLDGDEYCVIWDKNFIPRRGNYDAMDYTSAPPREVACAFPDMDMEWHSFHVSSVSGALSLIWSAITPCFLR